MEITLTVESPDGPHTHRIRIGVTEVGGSADFDIPPGSACPRCGVVIDIRMTEDAEDEVTH